jgi:hypothetical protein
METLFSEIEAALASNLVTLALMGTITIPDICAALGSSNGKTSEAKYIEWFDKNVAPLYYLPAMGIHTEDYQVVTGQDCYGLRCSLLHQGRARPHKGQYQRILLMLPGGPAKSGFIRPDKLILGIEFFCQNIVDAARTWCETARGSSPYDQNYTEYMKYYPDGLSPGIGGCPTIS